MHQREEKRLFMGAITKFSILAGSVALAALAVLACKPPYGSPDSSSAKSLDNLAKDDNATAVDNRCGRDVTAASTALSAPVRQALALVDAPTVALKDAAASALTAVPERLMAPFLNAGGKIRIGDGAESECAGSSLAAAEKDLAGNQPIRACWRQPEGGGAPELLIAGDETVVRHSLLRLFAYVYAEFFVTKIADPNAPAPFNNAEWRAAAQGFQERRGALAAALLADLSQAGAQAYTRLKTFHDRDATRFANFVLAEAVDSYYCTPKARAIFENRFRGAWKLFTDSTTPHAPLSVFGVAN